MQGHRLSTWEQVAGSSWRRSICLHCGRSIWVNTSGLTISQLDGPCQRPSPDDLPADMAALSDVDLGEQQNPEVPS